MSPYIYSHLIPPPRSKLPFYSTSPHWTDLTPITLITHGPPDQTTDPGPTLAAIAYSERYLEAMGYLRAVIAADEKSERVLALTEDVIGMNPAHYTVWLLRMAVLRELWGVEGEEAGGVGRVVEEVDDGANGEGQPRSQEEIVRESIERELEWLEAISERNLKNYQIWHHRQSLLSLLPPTSPSTSPALPQSEIPFLMHILTLDSKNYHVWTYRQWLCRTFPHYLLPPHSYTEIACMDELIDEDIRNNSAWSHRYFVIFGHEELKFLKGSDGKGGGMNRKELFEDFRKMKGQGLLKVDEMTVEREIGYAKEKIGLAPQNLSAWNYLRGVLRRAGRSLGTETTFCESFVRPETEAEGSGLGPGEASAGRKGELDFFGEGVRSSHAIDWLAEIYAEQGREEDAGKCLDALGEKWDPIRKGYWEYRRKLMERGEYAGT